VAKIVRREGGALAWTVGSASIVGARAKASVAAPTAKISRAVALSYSTA